MPAIYIQKKNEFLLQLKQLPIRYAEYANYLFERNLKFEDVYFPPEWSSIAWETEDKKIKWMRLSERSK